MFISSKLPSTNYKPSHLIKHPQDKLEQTRYKEAHPTQPTGSTDPLPKFLNVLGVNEWF